jgi:hypothetical protein
LHRIIVKIYQDLIAKMKSISRNLFNKILAPVTDKLNNLDDLILYQIKLSNGFSRAAATMHSRTLDSTDPLSWEFSGFSQNGEDGIIDYLISKLKSTNRYFIEIGASNGIENNTAWLAHAKKYSGLMIDGSAWAIEIAKKITTPFVDSVVLFVNADNINQLKDLSVYKDPDLFSLDIDGNDYYMVKLILESGFRPKIFVVEYNSAYGPEQSKTIQYAADFDIHKAHTSHLYYGVSIHGWKNLFHKHGYTFITTDSNGVNGFFADASQFDREFLSKIKGLPFRENAFQMRKFKFGWEKQFELIKDMNFFEIK